MFEVNEDNYYKFLSYHGRDPEVAQLVIDQHDKTASYYKLKSVYLWVEASKIVVKLHG